MTTAERRELRDLVERYALAVDRADAAAVAELFEPDGVLAIWLDPSLDKPSSENVGTAAITKALDVGLGHYAATHHSISSHASNVEGVTATGETMCTAHHLIDDKGKRSDRVLYIRYLDSYVRSVGPWRFSRREVRVQWMSTLPVDAPVRS
jgi:ketosteroid isomerase-like protein